MIKVFSLLLICLAMNASAQQAAVKLNLPDLDKSPMDMAYYPTDFPLLKIQDKVTEPLLARVIYSRPQKEDRVIFGGLVEYNKVWRLGANEATEIEFYKDVRINNKKLPKGRYTLYAIPKTGQWTIIFNKDTDIWGAFRYDEKKDVLRAEAAVQKTAVPVNAFTISFVKSDTGVNMLMAWDDTIASLPIAVK